MNEHLRQLQNEFNLDFPENLPRVDAIQVFESRGPWKSKSGGFLMVPFALPIDRTTTEFFKYDSNELSKVGTDIRGLRVYTVRDLPLGGIGGTEFHRIREELAFTLDGRVKWILEDLYGEKREFILSSGKGIWIRPFVLHTYEVLEDKSSLFITCNTLFDPGDSRTQDTYSQEVFKKQTVF